MTTVEVLRAAKARIDTPGKWCGDERGGTNDHGGVCAVHAVGVALGARMTYIDAAGHPATLALARAIGIECEPIGGGVAHWNDTHAHAEVMAAFDIAIANEEARAQEFEVAPVFEVAR